MKILLFQVYGDKPVYHLELTYSVLSAARFLRNEPSDIRIVLAADEPNLRPDLPVESLLVSPAMLREWQMDGTYSHAIQAFLLHHAISVFEVPTILVDTDTIFHAHPERMFDRIGPGKSLMHAKEGTLLDSLQRQKWEELIRRVNGDVAGYAVRCDSVMYNAGVLGLHPENVELLADAKAVMKRVREESDVFTAVQLAASLVFGSRTELFACEDLVEHYWGGPRAYYQYQMKRMFPEVLTGRGMVRRETKPLEPLRQTPPRRIVDRVAARIKRMQRGNDREYGHAYLSYLSALSAQAVDGELANVWSSAALDQLIWGMSRGRRDETAQDFNAFAPDSLNRYDWMDENLRSRWQAYWENGSAQSISSGTFRSER